MKNAIIIFEKNLKIRNITYNVFKIQSKDRSLIVKIAEKVLIFILFVSISFAQEEKILPELIELENKVENLVLNTEDLYRLKNQTKTTALLAVGTLGVLYLLPTSYTGWDRDTLKDINGSYKHNVENRGIIWDPDDGFFNYIAHPYVGAVYYIAARKSGYDEFKSFLYSFTMSALLWELGIEAVSQSPSMQDLVITPGVGAILGEYLYGFEDKIIKNNGKIANSKFIGRTALFLIDPVGSVSNIIGFKDNKVKGFWSFQKDYENRLQLNYNFRSEF